MTPSTETIGTELVNMKIMVFRNIQQGFLSEARVSATKMFSNVFNLIEFESLMYI